MTREQMSAELKRISADKLIATNSGTFSASDCMRAVGTGDPTFGEYRIFERIDGSVYTVGCDPNKAPGYSRRFGGDSSACRRAKMKALTAALKAAKSIEEKRSSDIAQLSRGWWGFRFVGIEEGQRRIASLA